MERVPRREGVSYAGLILNRKGLDRAVGAGVDEVNVVVCVSDTFSGRNQNATADEAMRMAGDVVDTARSRGLYTTITLATAFGCPFEGEVDPARVAEFARRCADAGVQELCLADTVGVGAPGQVTDLTARMRDRPRHGRPAAALPLPQHPQHRVRQRLRRGHRGRRRAGRQRRRHRRLPVRAEGHRQHRHRRPRLHAGTDGPPDRDRPARPCCPPRSSSASSSATRCPPWCPGPGPFPDARHAHPQAAGRPPARRHAHPRRRHHRGRRPRPDRGRHRHDVRDAVRDARRRRGRRAARGDVRRPQRAADRRPQHAGPPLPALVRAAVRAAVLPAGARDLALRAPGALRPARRAAAGRRLAQHHGRRARHVRDRGRWAGGRRGHGRLRVRPCPARGWSGSS